VPNPFRSVVLDEAGSTNTVAFERAQAGEPGPLWIVARRQTQGRGRSGRQWASEPGNLYASLLQRVACPQAVVHQLSLLAGVAAVEAIAAAAGDTNVRGLRLKWPNDVLIGEAKCAGILPESQSDGRGTNLVVVIGIGINLTSHPAHINRAATNLAAHGLRVTPEAMLSVLAAAMERWLAIWDRGTGFARVRAAWLTHGGAVGESLSVDTGKEKIAGTFLDLDAGGALVLRDLNGLQRTLTFGDVTLASSRSAGPSEETGR
jgi:BirA family transcriptional regulator, biotin operon repressor / biotin---[acetyl-CoA-carboxylase] ligase